MICIKATSNRPLATADFQTLKIVVIISKNKEINMSFLKLWTRCFVYDAGQLKIKNR
jgi:hypothetical protein